MTELSGYVFSALRGGEFTLYRGSGNGLEPILLVTPAGEYPARESLKRLEHEHDLKAELDADWAVRPVALSRHDGRMALVLEDPGGEPLDQLLGQPMDVTQFLHIAIPLAAAIGQVHMRGLIHKNLKPANILVDVASGGVRLTGFGIASRLPREHQAAATPPEVIAGTLAYMAPEQTGRMNRSVDARSDLYSLGITFYEMLTGTLPFTAADPMEWVHCHIARQPAPPDERVAGIPGPLSAIVMKLLAKTAEDRYQTAAGLTVDLRHCLAEWEAHRRIDPFPLGAHDASDRLLIPEKLYGREREIETLLASFDRVVAEGAPELVLVSGYSGIGKSSVVNELHKALVPPRGLFASGKFDQYQRHIPYATLGQAFQSLVRPLLSQSEAELGRWRDSLNEALGPNGQLIITLVPELELVIGKQPPVVDLPPRDAQNRFKLVFRRFLGVFARKEHPLALFLDDLQWLDAATLDLLEQLVTHSEVRHLLLVGAYRDNEVSPAHPLVRTLEAIRKAGARVQEIVLAPLGLDDVGQLVADAMHCESGRVRPLARLVQEKTGGNPFFAIQFFTALAEEGLLAFDPVTRAWQWNMDRIRAKNYTDNVVDLMVGKLTRLPAETQNALQQLACLGNIAEATTLSIVLATPEEQVHADLWEVVRLELIERLDDSYKFVHDRIQEAAYWLIPEELRGEAHLRIGRLLAAHIPPEKREEAIFEIVNQLNRGATLMTGRDEREQLAEFNLIAGKRASTSSAYESALKHFIAGLELLPKDAWERHHELTFALELHRAECEFLTGALAAAEEHLVALSSRGLTTVERASITCLQVDLYTTLDLGSRAIAVGLDYLQHLDIDIDWSPHPTEDEALRVYERIWSQLGPRTVESLIDLPLMTDPATLATLDVLTKLGPPAHYTDANLRSLIICQAVNLSLESGNCDGSCYAYAVLGGIAGPYFGDYQAGFRFARLSYELVEQRGLKRFQARTYLNFGYLLMFWTRHVRKGRELLQCAFDTANQTGDLTYAAYYYTHLNTYLLAVGDPLEEVQVEAERGFAFAEKMRFGFAMDSIAGQLGLIRTLRGLTPLFGRFDNGQFDELQLECRFRSNRDLAMAEGWYWIRKLQARFFSGDYAEALAAAANAQRLLWTTDSFFEGAEYHFYGALAQAAACDFATAEERRGCLETLADHRRQLVLWAENCPDHFENRAVLVGAEIARLEGRDLDAQRLYEQAIRSARTNGFVHNEALAYEVTARFYAARGFDEIARLYLRNARYCYVRWGADGKVRQLDQSYPQLMHEPPVAGPTSMIGASVERLDLATVIKVSQAVSGEIVLDKLLDTLMRTAIAQAGAERGLLILSRAAEPRIAAEATTDGDAITVDLRDQPVSAAVLPESVLHYILRTQESVILDDATAQPPFAADPYIQQHHARSILGLPLLNQARLIGVLYLENNLAPRVFAPARIPVLKLLASQAAISLENTRLYRDLSDREAKIRRLVDANIIGIFLWDFDGRILEANDAFLHMVGYDREDLVAGRLRWTDLTPPEWYERDEQWVEEHKRTGLRRPIEKEFFRKDSGRVPILLGAATFGESENQGVAFVLDLTDRKRAEEAARRSEKELRDVIETVPAMVWTALPDGHVDFINRRWQEFTGMSLDETLGWNWAAEAPFHPDDVEQYMGKWNASLATGQSFEAEMRIRRAADGEYRWLFESAVPLRDEQGTILKWYGFVVDIEDRKRGEEALQKAQMELAHVTRVITLGELTASIAHEVNQPLAAIVTNGAVGLRWLDREVPDLTEVREAFASVISDAERASEIIQRLRALSRKTETRKVALDINELIEEVIPLVQGQVLSHRVSLRLELAPTLPAVLGDRVQLQQVIINLVVNGMEAMVPITDRPRELVVRSQLDDSGQVLIAVQDSGIGIDPETANKLFNAFFTTKPSGMGMGLSICRSIIEDHGGTLWASRNDGSGATFQFTLRSHQEVGS